MARVKKEKNPNRIKAPEAILFDGGARIGITAAGAMISSYLLLFYVKCGLDLSVVATIFLVSKLFDAFNDVFNAYFFDRIPKDKFGRLKVIGIICTIIFAINFACLWLGPYMAIGNLNLQYVIVWITYILFGITQDIVEIPYNMFCALQTEDEKQRANLAPLKAVAQVLGGVIITMIFPMIVTSVRNHTGGEDMPAYIIAVVIVVAINAILTPIAILACKKRVDKTIQAEEKVKLGDIFKCLKIREVLVSCACQIGVTGGLSVFYSSIVFFSEYVMNQGQAITGMMNTLSGVGLTPWIIFGSVLMRKVNKKNIVVIGAAFATITFALRMIMPTTVWWIYALAALASVGTGVFNVVLPVMSLECNEIVEYKLGRRAEATIGAINTFFVKIGNTLAVVVPAFILAAYGFDTDLASFSANNPEKFIELYGSLYTPAPGATNAIIFCTHMLPAIFYFVTFIILMFWNHSKKDHEKMMKELEARREEAAVSTSAE